MIDFSLTDNQTAVRDMAREVAQKVIAPSITEFDRAQKMNPEVLPAMKDANLLGFCIPEQYGGLGMDYISLGLASDELEHADTSARVILSVHIGLFSLPVLTWANEEQKQKYLIPAAKGEKISTFGLTEPAAGSDAVGIQSTAVKDGDHYILNGEKMWISLADVADQFLVFAWTDLDKKTQSRPQRPLGVYCRTGLGRSHHRDDPRQVRCAGRQHRVHIVSGCQGAQSQSRV